MPSPISSSRASGAGGWFRWRPAHDARLRSLHRRGWPDVEIARAFRCERHTVGDHRRRLGLPSNGYSERVRARIRRGTRRQLRRMGMASLAELRSAAHRAYAVRCGWPADLRKREVEILNLLWDRGPMTRAEIATAIGWNMARGQRALLACGCHKPANRGSYLANLKGRGLLVRLRRVVCTGRRGGNVDVYSLPLEIRRRLPA